MKRLSLYYEAQPFHVNQAWGVYDPDTYLPFGFTEHNGIDIAHGYNSRVRAPFQYQIYRTIWQPEGGGHVLTIVSKDKYDFDDGVSCYVLIDYLHLEKYVKTQGEGDTGDLLCIAGNSGAASDGPHTHIQARRVRKSGSKFIDIDKNDANGSFDQMPYYNGLYAVDYRKPKEPVLVETDPDIDVVPVLSAAKVSLEQLPSVPEPQRATIVNLWKAVLELISRALTKG